MLTAQQEQLLATLARLLQKDTPAPIVARVCELLAEARWQDAATRAAGAQALCDLALAGRLDAIREVLA